jgi:putative colanic acid biosynthesis acetyltransferase WcaF
MATRDPQWHMLKAERDRDPFAGAPSFPLRHRLLRAVWRLTWLLLASWTPPPLRRWRIFLANLFGAKIDPSASLHGSIRIWYPPFLTMARQASLAPGVDCYCMAPITIGERAVVSQRAFLCAGSHDIHDPTFQIEARPIVVEARSWVCAEAFVGPGVTVGEGAVLAARAAAFRDLEPWTVYRGNPAEAVGRRERGDPV